MDLKYRLWLEQVIEDLAQPYLDKEYVVPDVAVDVFLRIAPLGLPHKHFLSVKEVAELLGCHPQAVRRLIWSGKLEAIRGGKRGLAHKMLIPIGSVLAYFIKYSSLNVEL